MRNSTAWSAPLTVQGIAKQRQSSLMDSLTHTPLAESIPICLWLSSNIIQCWSSSKVILRRKVSRPLFVRSSWIWDVASICFLDIKKRGSVDRLVSLGFPKTYKPSPAAKEIYATFVWATWINSTTFLAFHWPIKHTHQMPFWKNGNSVTMPIIPVPWQRQQIFLNLFLLTIEPDRLIWYKAIRWGSQAKRNPTNSYFAQLIGTAQY